MDTKRLHGNGDQDQEPTASRGGCRSQKPPSAFQRGPIAHEEAKLTRLRVPSVGSRRAQPSLCGDGQSCLPALLHYPLLVRY